MQAQTNLTRAHRVCHKGPYSAGSLIKKTKNAPEPNEKAQFNIVLFLCLYTEACYDLMMYFISKHHSFTTGPCAALNGKSYQLSIWGETKGENESATQIPRAFVQEMIQSSD